MNVKRANNVAGIFSPGLRLAQGTKLVFLFNPESDVFSLTLDSELIENERFFVSDLKASCRNQGDSISLFVTAADLFAKGMYMPDFSVIGGAKENRINLAARFNNSDNGTYALLGTTSTLGRDPQSGVPQVRVRFNPSSFTTNGRTWRIWAGRSFSTPRGSTSTGSASPADSSGCPSTAWPRVAIGIRCACSCTGST